MISNSHLQCVSNSFAELEALIDMLELIGVEMGGTPIEDPYYAKVRNATCGVIEATVEKAERARRDIEELYRLLPKGDKK